MAISRSQLPRQNYGLGSFVKKAVKKITKPFTKFSKKIVPKEIAGIMRVAAPFLPTGFREAAYLMGTARQTGRISPMDLALAAAPTFFKSDMGQGITNKIGGMNIPGSGGKTTFQEFLIGGEGKGTDGLFGSKGKMFTFGGNNDVGLLNTKIGQSFLGQKGKNGFQYDLNKLFGIGTGAIDYVKLQKALNKAPKEDDDSEDSEDTKFYTELFDKLDPDKTFAIDDEYVLKKTAANGGLMRANFEEGGGIFPRIDELGNSISSAEQELASINQRLDTAESYLGQPGGGGGIMDSSIVPDAPAVEATPFPAVTPDAPIADNISVNPVGSPQDISPIKTVNPVVGGGRVPGGFENPNIDVSLISGPVPAVDLPGGMPSKPIMSNQILPMSNQYTHPTLPPLQGGGPRIPRLPPNVNTGISNLGNMLPLQTAQPGSLVGYGKPADPRMGGVQVAGNTLQQMMRGSFADGGILRQNYALGSRPTVQESGLGGLPIEADMRYTGGFMPYGAVEKADDVPARLSKNEFVFTADAVRAAGGGSVQKGAKKMYDTMKKLEQQPEAKGAMA
jgi:hypothetical protein